jgi:hypothetical protein
MARQKACGAGCAGGSVSTRISGPPFAKNGDAQAGNLGAKSSQACRLGLDSKRSRLPSVWREHLLDPSQFHMLELKHPRSIGAMGSVTCPFHTDDEQRLTSALASRRGVGTRKCPTFSAKVPLIPPWGCA